MENITLGALLPELARHSLPLARRLQHFKSNWARITQDPWVLEAIQGYRVPISQQPYQTCPPRAHPQAEKLSPALSRSLRMCIPEVLCVNKLV